jgi:hypothetical protein
LTARRFSVTIESERLGRVLDLTQDIRWQTFMKARATPLSATNEELIRQANENYSRMFEESVEINKIPIQEYDAIKGPEFVRGGTQICIWNPQIQAEVRAALTDLPMSTSVAGATETVSVPAVEGGSGAAASETTAAAVASGATTTAESAAETAAVFGTGTRAASLAGRLAIGLLEAAALVIVTLGLEYLKHKADREHLSRDLQAAQPKIASSITALIAQARLLQQRSASRTVWAAVSIKLDSWVTEMWSDYGFPTMVENFQGASFLEPVTLSLQYRRDRREQRGEPIRQVFAGGSSTSYLVPPLGHRHVLDTYPIRRGGAGRGRPACADRAKRGRRRHCRSAGSGPNGSV